MADDRYIISSILLVLITMLCVPIGYALPTPYYEYHMGESTSVLVDAAGHGNLTIDGSLNAVAGILGSASQGQQMLTRVDDSQASSVGMQTNWSDASNFSVSSWMKFDPLTSTGDGQNVWSTLDNHNTGDFHTWLMLHNGLMGICYVVNSFSVANDWICYPESNLSANVWYNVVVTYDGSTKNMSLYLDGQLVNTKITAVTGTSAPDGTLTIFSNKDALGPPYYGHSNASMDEVQVYMNTLSSSDVASLYSSYTSEYTAETTAVYAYTAGSNPDLYALGTKIDVNEAGWYIKNVTLDGATDANKVMIVNGSTAGTGFNVLAVADVIGGVATFASPVLVVAGESYSVVASSNVSGWTLSYSGGSAIPPFPVNTQVLNYSARTYGFATDGNFTNMDITSVDTVNWQNVKSIGLTKEPVFPPAPGASIKTHYAFNASSGNEPDYADSGLLTEAGSVGVATGVIDGARGPFSGLYSQGSEKSFGGTIFGVNTTADHAIREVFRVNSSGLYNYQQVYTTSNYVAYNYGESVAVDASGNLVMYVDVDGVVNMVPVTVIAPIADDQWHNLIINYNATEKTYYAYVDGVSKANVTNVAVNVPTTSGALHIGAVTGYNGAPGLYVDDFLVFDGFLTNAQIIQYSNTTAPVCTENWQCSNYDVCMPNNVSACLNVTDLNTCGNPFMGNISVYDNVSCGYVAPCVANWTCSVYGACMPNNVSACTNVTDLNVCGSPFTGNMSMYNDVACGYEQILFEDSMQGNSEDKWVASNGTPMAGQYNFGTMHLTDWLEDVYNVSTKYNRINGRNFTFSCRFYDPQDGTHIWNPVSSCFLTGLSNYGAGPRALEVAAEDGAGGQNITYSYSLGGGYTATTIPRSVGWHDAQIFGNANTGQTYILIDGNVGASFSTPDLSTVNRIGVYNSKLYSGELSSAFENISLAIDTSVCIENWQCSNYDVCMPNNVSACLNVTDLNTCGNPFMGNVSSYDAACVYNLYGSSYPNFIYTGAQSITIDIGACFNISENGWYVTEGHSSHGYNPPPGYQHPFIYGAPSSDSIGGNNSIGQYKFPYVSLTAGQQYCLDMPGGYPAFSAGASSPAASFPLVDGVITWTGVGVTYYGFGGWYGLNFTRVYLPKYSRFNGSTTNFTAVNVSAVNGMIIEKTGVFKIEWSQPVNALGADFDTAVQYGSNWVSVDTSLLYGQNSSSINTSANITFRGAYTSPTLFADGALCSSCVLLFHNATETVFSVPHFTNYSVEELYVSNITVNKSMYWSGVDNAVNVLWNDNAMSTRKVVVESLNHYDVSTLQSQNPGIPYTSLGYLLNTGQCFYTNETRFLQTVYAETYVGNPGTLHVLNGSDVEIANLSTTSSSGLHNTMWTYNFTNAVNLKRGQEYCLYVDGGSGMVYSAANVGTPQTDSIYWTRGYYGGRCPDVQCFGAAGAIRSVDTMQPVTYEYMANGTTIDVNISDVQYSDDYDVKVELNETSFGLVAYNRSASFIIDKFSQNASNVQPSNVTIRNAQLDLNWSAATNGYGAIVYTVHLNTNGTNQTVVTSNTQIVTNNTYETTNGKVYVTASDGIINLSSENDVPFTVNLSTIIESLNCPVDVVYPNEDNYPSAAVMSVNMSILAPFGFHNDSMTGQVAEGMVQCTGISGDMTHKTYVCDVPMQYFQAPGNYSGSIFGQTSVGKTVNVSTAGGCVYGALLASKRVTSSVSFPTAAPGVVNAPGNTPVLVRNTGNVIFNVSMTGQDLTGQTTPSMKLHASDFRAGSDILHSVALITNTSVQVSLPVLPSNGSNTYLWVSMPSNIIAQAYRTTVPWEVTVQ